MSKGDRDARILQDATGARYMTCLARVRALRGIAAAPGTPRAIDAFMDRVDKLPDLLAAGHMRCVTCLGLCAAGVDDCVCS